MMLHNDLPLGILFSSRSYDEKWRDMKQKKLIYIIRCKMSSFKNV